VGLAGHMYWLSLWPFHQVMFPAMIHGIAQDSGCLLADIERKGAGV
jgi:hypothetical protein